MFRKKRTMMDILGTTPPDTYAELQAKLKVAHKEMLKEDNEIMAKCLEMSIIVAEIGYTYGKREA